MYTESKVRDQKIVDALPLKFAFGDQIVELLKEAKSRGTKLVSLGAGAFCFKEDEEHIVATLKAMNRSTAKRMESYDFAYEAFYYELGNHEYHINTYQGDWDTVSAFYDVEWKEDRTGEEYLELAGAKPDTVRAYTDARKAYMKEAMEHDDWW